MTSHNNLYSFVFSLILTSAMIPSSGNVTMAAAGAPAAQMAATAVLSGLRAQGLAGGADVALPAPASTPAAIPVAARPAAGPTLTPETMAKLLKLVADKGVDRDLNPLAASTLGLVNSGQTWASRAVNWKENNGTLHSFYVNRGTDQDLAISLAIPDKTIYGYRFHRDGTVITAFTFDMATRQITMLSADQAQKPLDAQVAFWINLAGNQVTASN